MKKYKPTSPSRRHQTTVTYRGVLTKKKPEKSLTKGFKRSVGRNNQGRITTRHKGGGHKRLYREVDFMYNKHDIPAKISSIEYDPNRNAFIGLAVYKDGEKRYVIVPKSIKVGDKFIKRLTAKTDNVITFSSRGKAMISLISKSANKVIIKCIEEKIEFKPYIFSDLTIVQAMATVAAAFLLNIDLKKTGEVISNFTPKENRMRKYRFKEWRILFDPMLTHGAYIKELSDYYIKTDKTLILYDVDFSEENSTPIIPELIKLFNSFSRVIILNSEKNVNIFIKYELPHNTKFSPKDKLLEDVPKDSLVILHYAKYFRLYDDVNFSIDEFF